MEKCPCGSGRDYSTCCEPVITGKSPAATAEALMRSRYSAYAKGAIDHIVDSCVGGREGLDYDSTKRWSERSTWQGLQIHRVEKGGATDEEGLVEFTATYVMDGLREEHREIASFAKKEGKWLYESGEVVPRTVVREGPKVGRNEPCPCGSGKKFKQCHGK